MNRISAMRTDRGGDRLDRASGLHIAGGVAATLALAGLATHWRTGAAERENPPLGRFIDVDGVRLHLLERGRGAPLLVIHGAGAMMQDMLSSGVVGEASAHCRVIVVDRPGQGFSSRPDDRSWTPEAQADLLARTLDALGVADAIVLGHSWGALVALALAVRHPRRVAGLVLASGYYFATPRLDVPLLASAALPVLGDIGRHTLLPLIGRAIWPLMMRRLFGPAIVPARFEREFPKWLALRPAQLRAVAEDIAMLRESAARLSPQAGSVAAPTAIVAGVDDRLVDARNHSIRFHRSFMPHAALHLVGGAGHMVHHSAPGTILSIIDEIAAIVAAEENERQLAPPLLSA